VETRDVAQAMLDLLPNYRTWAHGRLIAGPRVCLLGARLRIGGHEELTEDETVDHLDWDEYTQLLARTITEQFPERGAFRADGTVSPHQSVICFNDHERTRFTDVRMVLEKTAASCAEG